MKEDFAWLTRRDGKVVIGRGPFEASEHPPDDGVAFFKRSFVGKDEKPWWIPATHEVIGVDEFRKRHPRSGGVTIEWQVPEAMPFSLVFQEIMTRISQGLIEKTVPVVTEVGRIIGEPSDFFLGAMCGQDAPLYSYGWVGEGKGFAGATPELLFTQKGTELVTMALAGTARADDEDAFVVDEKEIREHEYVAQTLVSKLSDLGGMKRMEREVMRLGSIVHFQTNIHVELEKEHEVLWLLKRLHPTPALGPLPRTDETMAMLAEWRGRLGCPREFGAPFGVWERGDFEAVVAIRGLWWEGQKVLLPAGCGIIEASRLVNEWRELRLKREAVKRFLTI